MIVTLGRSFLLDIFSEYILQSLIFTQIQVSAVVALAPPQLRLRRRHRRRARRPPPMLLPR